MCRLFGFRSIVSSEVHRSLVAAENALGIQSANHPDGWGVAYYLGGAPHLVKSPAPAQTDQLFHRVSGVVSSETVIAHIRKATAGPITVLNAHPFQFGSWVFAHNGEIPNFAQYRTPLMARVPDRLRRFVLGETDSEVCFFLFIAALQDKALNPADTSVSDIVNALSSVRSIVLEICGEDLPEEKLLLNFLVTDGNAMVAYRQGKSLYWSSYKTRCEDRAECPNLSTACEAPTSTGHVQHLIISSEPLGEHSVWNQVPDHHFVGVDQNMKLFIRSKDLKSHPMLTQIAS